MFFFAAGGERAEAAMSSAAKLEAERSADVSHADAYAPGYSRKDIPDKQLVGLGF